MEKPTTYLPAPASSELDCEDQRTLRMVFGLQEPSDPPINFLEVDLNLVLLSWIHHMPDQIIPSDMMKSVRLLLNKSEQIAEYQWLAEDLVASEKWVLTCDLMRVFGPSYGCELQAVFFQSGPEDPNHGVLQSLHKHYCWYMSKCLDGMMDNSISSSFSPHFKKVCSHWQQVLNRLDSHAFDNPETYTTTCAVIEKMGRLAIDMKASVEAAYLQIALDLSVHTNRHALRQIADMSTPLPSGHSSVPKL